MFGVRRGVPDDAEVLAELWLRSRRASPGIPPPVHADDEVRRWFRDVVLTRLEVWVATVAGEAAAVMALDGEWIEQLYVEPTRRRAGHGSRLLQVAKDDRENLALWTFEANLEARAFYEARGFERVGPVSVDNEEGAPALCYRWSAGQK